MNPSLRRRPSLCQYIVSYAPDWIITCASWWIFYYISRHVTGFKREFSLADLSLRHPYALHSRVGTNALWMLSGGLPLAVQVVVNLFFVRSCWDLHHSTLGLVLSLAITGSITQVVKVAVGRPRPDVIARCQPPPGAEDPLWGLSTIDICTQTSKQILEDGWRSFPSGHSSLAFAGLGFLTFYLAGKLHLFDGRGYTSKVWLSLVPLGLASWITITRTMDYRHHWADVFTGSVLGLVMAYFSYRQYYPHLGSKTSHVPFTTRFDVVAVGHDVEDGMTVFRDEDGGNEEAVRLLGGNRKPRTTPIDQA